MQVAPANRNYFFHELQPWVHYIAVSSNLSDLAEAIRFAVSQETEPSVRAIIHRANEWCRLRATKDRFAMDLALMLQEYVRLLGIMNNETRWHQWQELFQDYERTLTLKSPVYFDYDLCYRHSLYRLCMRMKTLGRQVSSYFRKS